MSWGEEVITLGSFLGGTVIGTVILLCWILPWLERRMHGR